MCVPLGIVYILQGFSRADPWSYALNAKDEFVYSFIPTANKSVKPIPLDKPLLRTFIQNLEENTFLQFFLFSIDPVVEPVDTYP